MGNRVKLAFQLERISMRLIGEDAQQSFQTIFSLTCRHLFSNIAISYKKNDASLSDTQFDVKTPSAEAAISLAVRAQGYCTKSSR
jgi:hypothetical protein